MLTLVRTTHTAQTLPPVVRSCHLVTSDLKSTFHLSSGFFSGSLPLTVQP